MARTEVTELNAGFCLLPKTQEEVSVPAWDKRDTQVSSLPSFTRDLLLGCR